MVLVLFSGTVFIHELGHFLTAKWFKLRIDAFSIGMGPVIWEKVKDGCAYRVSLLPIGGYVALPQLDITGSAFENEDAKKGKLEPVDPWKRIVIAVAGPFMNIITAFVLAVVVWGFGKPYDPGPNPAIVGWVSEESPAYEAGLREGDLIRDVNGDRIHFWTDFMIAGSLNKELDLVIVRDQHLIDVTGLQTKRNSMGFLYLPGVLPVEFIEYIYINSLTRGSPALEAGLLPGDILYQVNGQEVVTSEIFINTVRASDGDPVNITILRGPEREELHFEILPEFDHDLKRHLIGIGMGTQEQKIIEHPRPVRQMHFFSGVIFRTLRGLIRPRERMEAAGGIGGPAIMLGSIHDQVRLHPMQALWFTALINVNLAIINLLPLIVLDGGHVMVALYEIIFRRPPHRKVIIGLANGMVVLLLSLMVVLTVKDVRFYLRLNRLRSENETPAIVERPTPTPTAVTETDSVPVEE